MILLDASIWIDHLRSPEPDLASLLDAGKGLCHPFVIGEVALGQFRERDTVIETMRQLPISEIASNEEVMTFIERYRAFGRGIGFVDAHLLVSTLLTDGARFWTRDKRLKSFAESLDLAATGFL